MSDSSMAKVFRDAIQNFLSPIWDLYIDPSVTEIMINGSQNIFIEKTLNLSIPFEAKYGVEMKNQAIHIDSKAKQVTVFLPPVQLLSFQLLLNNLEAIGKTGWLNSLSLDDLVKVEKILYNT